MHRYHPDQSVGDPSDALLYDDCEDCAHKADTLVGLDAHRSAEMIRRVFLWRQDSGAIRPTHTEARFMRGVDAVLVTMERAGVNIGAIREAVGA